ncbi:MAG: 1-aminocyclopropane-1-carboxylate deaminase/D-cysteine desulfhydrase [Colwellia sp.]|nr:1-aminocyclopropane-1-carboxylate deaminase/D-cysteine desulfhydrase [Colwellia sp.]
MSIVSILQESPIQTVKMCGFQIHVKRDDLLNDYFSGNKARKFAYYLGLSSGLSSSSNSDNDSSQIKKIVSYGSIQANSLYSLAALAKLKNWQLDYYVTRIANWLKDSPAASSQGNYGGALKLGANIIEVADDEITKHGKNLDDFMTYKAQTFSDNILFIPEGGRSTLAQYGINQLAKELNQYCQQSKIKHAFVMLPAGTGTTALFLQTWFKQQQLPHQVLTCACVGGDDYLRKQFTQLNRNTEQWPTILTPQKKYHFGKLYAEFYQLWQQLNDETDIEFDLLYDPLGWQVLLEFLNVQTRSSDQNVDVIYIHQGGIIGNQTMLPRYQRKYPDIK